MKQGSFRWMCSLLIVLACAVAMAAGCTSNKKSATGQKTSSSAIPIADAAQNPCRLVTKAEAESILNAKISDPQTRPLGPTCAYNLQDLSRMAVLSVQSLNFSQIRPLIQNISTVNGLGYPAFCGEYGGPQVYVVLTDRSVLAVAAQCDIGTQFAKRAVARLSRV